MQAIRELEALKRRLEAQIAAIQLELDTISKTIKILERETPGASAQMTLPETTTATVIMPPQVTEDVKAAGLSDLCRQMAESWIAPVDVRDQIMALGYHNTDKQKLLSSVYATMKRLSINGTLERRQEGGRTEFRRKTSATQEAA